MDIHQARQHTMRLDGDEMSYLNKLMMEHPEYGYIVLAGTVILMAWLFIKQR